MAGVLAYGERLRLTPLTWLDLMRTDGSLSVERHIKQPCHRSAVEFYAKAGPAFTWRWPSEVHWKSCRCRARSGLIFQLGDAGIVEGSTHTHTLFFSKFRRKKFSYGVKHIISKYWEVITVWTQKASTALHIPPVNTNTQKRWMRSEFVKVNRKAIWFAWVKASGKSSVALLSLWELGW